MAHLKGAGPARSVTSLAGMPRSGDLVCLAQSFGQRRNWQNFKHKTEPYIVCGHKAYEVEV